MAKYVLENNFEFDFKLFSIVCHDSEYRLCSVLNQTLNLDLQRDRNIELKNKKQSDLLFFSVFTCFDEETQLEYILINNLSSNASKIEEPKKDVAQAGLFDDVEETAVLKKGRLIPEKEDADFLLMINGDLSDVEKNRIIKKAGSVDSVLSITELNPEKLSSRNNLLF